jgi:uncharacterized membrane protein YhaH (DUF805 family)
MQRFLDLNIATFGQYFKIDGVATRLQYWYFVLFTWIISLGASIADIFIPGNQLENIFTVIFFVPSLTAAIRRMHDTDHSGWWLLFPIVNFIFLVSPTRPSRWSGASKFQA